MTYDDTIPDERTAERGQTILEIFAEGQSAGHAFVDKIVAKFQERKGCKNRDYYEANKAAVEARRRDRRAAARVPRVKATPEELKERKAARNRARYDKAAA